MDAVIHPGDEESANVWVTFYKPFPVRGQQWGVHFWLLSHTRSYRRLDLIRAIPPAAITPVLFMCRTRSSNFLPYP